MMTSTFDTFERTPYDDLERAADSADFPFADTFSTRTLRCRACNAPLHTFEQEALMPGAACRTYVECHEKECVLFMQTLCAEDYADVDMARYGSDEAPLGDVELRGV